MITNYTNIAFTIPSGLQTFTIQSGENVLVLREPVAADFLLAETVKDKPNIHERAFIMAERLAVSWNGEPGVSAIEIGMLNRVAYKEVLNLTSQWFLDIMPNIGTEFLQKYLQDQREQLPELDDVRTDAPKQNSKANKGT